MDLEIHLLGKCVSVFLSYAMFLLFSGKESSMYERDICKSLLISNRIADKGLHASDSQVGGRWTSFRNPDRYMRG